MNRKLAEWEKTIINLSDAILNHPELPMGQAIAIAQAKATWDIAFLAGARSRDLDVDKARHEGYSAGAMGRE